MKVKHLSAAFFLSALTSYAQVSEDFNKASLSSGSLACWESEYTSQFFTTARVAAGAALSADSRLTLNTATSITGSASLRVNESITVPVSRGATSTETITSPALGVDGNTVSFKVRLNSASLPSALQYFYVIVICGLSEQYYPITASNIGNTMTINSTIAGSGGGGKIKIALWYNNDAYFNSPTTLSYSLDIDDFTTSAALDPANTCMTALPVILSSFSASRTENMVKLNWATTLETNSDRFEINRSADAKQWVVIGTEQSSGESDGQLAYQFTDRTPLSGTNYYRLKMIDRDGSYVYSTIRSVKAGNAGPATVLYPNPAVDKLFIRDKEGNQLSADQFQEFSIFDTKGSEMIRSTPQMLVSNTGIDLKGLTTGIYLLKIGRADGTQSTHKIMVRK